MSQDAKKEEDEEIAKRRDEALKRALRTPHKPHKEDKRGRNHKLKEKVGDDE